uniref:Acetyl-coenzyme A synthetase N-terminal domain-containing protein n=1 Tax=Otus sunia TaxID=257818 RepID=A0A8C8ARW1_9STRI
CPHGQWRTGAGAAVGGGGGLWGAKEMGMSRGRWEGAWSHGPLTAYMPEAIAFPRPKDHQGLYKVSVEQGDTFWGALGRSRLTWITPFHSVQDCDLHQGRVSWFLGGQLNVAVNCLDRHVHIAPDKVALIWEKDEPGEEVRVTYRSVLTSPCMDSPSMT